MAMSSLFVWKGTTLSSSLGRTNKPKETQESLSNSDSEEIEESAKSAKKEESQDFIQVAVNGPGTSFGELSLIHKRPRSASVMAVTDCVFAILSKANYQKMLLKQQKAELEMKTKFLQSIPFFRAWSNLALSKFSYFFVEKRYVRNQIVFKEGEKLDWLYIVRQGEFEVTRQMQYQHQPRAPDPRKVVMKQSKQVVKQRKLKSRIQISHLMQQNSSSQFQKLKKQKNYKKTNIKGLCGPGIIFGEEDIAVEKNYYQASSTVKWKSSDGLLFIISLENLERETKNQVRAERNF